MREKFNIGQRVEWLYESRGGYGYRYWVPSVIVRICQKRITIDAQLVNGSAKRISVSADKLRKIGAQQ